VAKKRPNPDVGQQIRAALAHQRQGRLGQAEAIYRRILRQRPNEPNALHLLGLVEKQRGNCGAAMRLIERAIRARPDAAEFHANLGATHLLVGNLDEAVASFERAVELNPDFAAARSNLLLAMQYRPGVTLAALDAAHRAWDERHAAGLEDAPVHRERDPERPLRLGFVSPDFYVHPVGIFIVRFLEALDRDAFETVCYANRPYEDDLTRRIRAAAGAWHMVMPLSDEALAEKIRADRIDVLFDLAGHTARHRLLTFAQRPAPVQMTWMGYVGTTGLTAMDYLVADRFHVPETLESGYRERILRLPDGYVVFDPPAEAPEVGPLPARAKDHVTFGCFNNPSKINDAVVEAWARILDQVPAARLILKYQGLGDAATRERLVGAFRGAGVDVDRLELLGKTPRADLLEQYNRVDVALDPFPYSGGLTTCEALWMGVPVVTRPGETFNSRHSLSHLSNVGLTETIADDADDYVRIAVALAGDLDRLAAIRADLRDRVAASPLCDGPRFARAMATALRAL
jgi:predicted O-linked N-acetylglucosamine transferase (SPINDLY family)